MRVCVKLVPCVKFNADVFLHQEGRALQSLEIRFFVLFWRRIIDFKKDETKKVFFVFAFDAPVSMMMNLLVSVSLFLSLALSLIVFLF